MPLFPPLSPEVLAARARLFVTLLDESGDALAACDAAHRVYRYTGSTVVAQRVAATVYAHRFTSASGEQRTVLTIHTAALDDLGGLSTPRAFYASS